MMRRMIKAHGRRVADGDIADLADLIALGQELDRVIAETVHHMRQHQEFSWAAIAEATGTSRQAAQQRWGRTAALARPVDGDGDGRSDASRLTVVTSDPSCVAILDASSGPGRGQRIESPATSSTSMSGCTLRRGGYAATGSSRSATA